MDTSCDDRSCRLNSVSGAGACGTKSCECGAAVGALPCDGKPRLTERVRHDAGVPYRALQEGDAVFVPTSCG